MNVEPEIRKRIVAVIKKKCIELRNLLIKNTGQGQAYNIVGKKRKYVGLAPSSNSGSAFSKKIRGNLQKSWSWEVDASQMKGRVGANYLITFFHERGTRKMAARPNLRMSLAMLNKV